MSKKEPQIIGKIIATRIREIDHSYVENRSKELTLEESIEKIKEMCIFEEDKTVMNQMIERLKEDWDDTRRS